MAFHGIMVVRDEGDIVAQVLAHLLTWVDSLHVYDTGSMDGTWEIGEDAARGERRRRFVVQAFPEPRLFRYRRGIKWPVGSYVPLCGGRTAVARIPVRHYRWRDPAQAAARCALRRAMREAGANVGPHWGLEDWR